jgi:hypothetical protein
VINPLSRSVKPEIVRPIIQACREHQRIEVEYSSLTSKKDYRNIAHHTLVFNGYRWYVEHIVKKTDSLKILFCPALPIFMIFWCT